MTIVTSKDHLAPRPRAATRFLRGFLPWQLLRFIVVNIRMTAMIIKSHGRH